MRQTLGALALLALGCTANIKGADGQNPAGPGPSGLGNPGSVASAGSTSGPGGGGSSGGASATPQACGSAAAPKAAISARIRRLSRLELENTLADLLGDKTRT